jgi:uncharacterized protein (DUF302 family)
MWRVAIKRSASGYGETVVRLTKASESRGLTVFARIDHAVAAREAGLDLADEQVVLFGNPRAGTPLMQSDPRIGIELPLRMFVWADADGVLLSHRNQRELGSSYSIAAEHHPILEQMATLVGELADEAAG